MHLLDLRLEHIPLFDRLNDRQRSSVRDLLRVETYKPGAVVREEGAHNPGSIFIIVHGEAALIKSGRSAADDSVIEYMVGVRGPNEIFGAMSVLDGQPASVTVRAKTPLTIAVLDLARDGMNKPARRIRNAIVSDLRRRLADRARASIDDKVASLQQEAEFARYRYAVGNILVAALSMLSVYTLALSLIPSFENLLEVNFAASPFIIVFFALIFFPVIRRSGFPLAFFGMRLDNWRYAMTCALVASGIFLALGVAVKWAIIMFSPSLSGMTVISFADVQVAQQPAMMSPWYWAAVCLYLILTPLQEFVARCGIQAPLYAFLDGSEVKRRMISIFVSTLVFSSAHAHISLEFAAAAFLPGILWGWIFARTNSLLAASVSHFIIGGAGVFLLGVEEFVAVLS
ncbi:MAG: cyclic nucleotide-binding domain-containing protein [Hyphomicrobiales bacterium]|nr:cyclic nucleotide-binding domain-containing protein [Hyphomicrobiales bacterium]